MHYARWVQNGDPSIRRPGFHKRIPLEVRFWRHVEKTDSCWLWIGNINYAGYGTFHRTGRQQDGRHLAHRVCYEMLVGEIPKGMELDHLCRVRNCVRPDHLEAVTHNVNVQRAAAFRYQS